MSGFRNLIHLWSSLYEYLIGDNTPFVSFVQDPHQSGILIDISSHKATFIFSANQYSKNIAEGNNNCYIYNLDWKPFQPWTQAVLAELKTLSLKRAVFFFCIEQVPLQLIEALEKCGCSEFIYREDSRWKRIDASQSRSGFTSWLKRFRTIRKVLLFLLGKKINIAQHASSISANGYGYKIRLPNNTTQDMSIKNHCSDILLFENDCRLDQPNTLITEIIANGKGRFCQQGLDLFFSASDSSDPRWNKRTYRFVDLKGPFKKLNCFFYSLSQNLPETSLPPVDFEVEMQSLITQSYKWNFKLSNLENIRPDHSKAICLFSGSLGPGGTERQLAYVAKHLSNAGKEVHIFTCEPLSETALHYFPILPPTATVKIQSITHPNIHFPEESLFTQPGGKKTLSLFLAMPDYMSEYVWNLYTHLMMIKPKVLHCWLDYPNLIGAMAGWLAGVPQIILSTRSLNPTHFPHLYYPWYQKWYQYLSRLPNVKLIGNSEAGIHDYSDWLNMPRSHFSLVKNGVDDSVIKPSSLAEIKDFRNSLNIENGTPVITGIFRLDIEKRPFTFLEVVKKIKERVPRLRVLIAGIGKMEKAVHKKAQDMGIDNWVTFLGRRQDVPLIMSASDLVLLTSSEEGTPNVLMEAQWLAKPVVCTGVGGVAEVVEHGKTGYILAKDDLEGLAEACCTLLGDAELRRLFGEAGQKYAKEHFSIEKMINNTVTFYDDQVQPLHLQAPCTEKPQVQQII